MRILHLLTCCLLTLAALPSAAQNIIPNPGYEALNSYLCPENPIEGFKVVQDWYVEGGATPHLFMNGCPYDQGVWRFYDPRAPAATGFSTVSLTGGLFVNGSFGSIPMGVPLSMPMQEGKEYYLQVDLRNRWIWHRIEDSLRICDTDPPKQVQISFGDANILDPTTFHQREPDLIFTDPILQSPEPSAWKTFNSCLTGTGDHTNLAVSMNQGPTQMSPPCEIRGLEHDPTYFNFHFDFDDWVLYPIPDRLDTVLSSCAIQSFLFDLARMAGVPSKVDISFRWADGFEGAKRTLSGFGVYDIIAELPCTSFPIRIEIKQEDCEPQVYVPTAFSPDGDGINDEFSPFIRSPLPVRKYRLQVFDRWGALVFSAEDPSQVWNGKMRGRLLAPGLYIWSLRLELGEGIARELIQQQGQLTLVR